MTALHLFSAASFVFVVAFTYRAYYAAPTPGQTPRSAIAEAYLNIVIGFAVNFVANLLILPLAGFHISFSDNLHIGVIYTAVSIVRQYVIRRYFNARLHDLALRFR